MERWNVRLRARFRTRTLRRLIDVHHQAGEVLERESHEKISWKLQRLQGIRLALEGQDGWRRIAQIVRVTTATLTKWINWYREDGIEGLLARALGAKGGNAPRFTPQEWERFRKQLAEGTWRTARDAQRWLRETLGLKISRKEVCRHLGKLGARLKVGRRSHVKKDPAATEAFKSGGLDAKLAALELPTRTVVRVWVCDESSGANRSTAEMTRLILLKETAGKQPKGGAFARRAAPGGAGNRASGSIPSIAGWGGCRG